MEQRDLSVRIRMGVGKCSPHVPIQGGQLDRM